ncbi:MarR family transcriptional regulator [Curtobacterium sp. MCPF17_002]|uniref:MarR family winged helix-turn-helix transcriptional regulator n=1 Tax=Curtobacterium sp. MCPF17_002 TaxID=2175645 RepID=UPI000DA85B71|nr:MarR family transcriptional regulator [Curtobacterium sp. MCPF17_002]WIB77982.1 MarR family transcriptional regulator [Curtobacterium sp. MCPF17_002]
MDNEHGPGTPSHLYAGRPGSAAGAAAIASLQALSDTVHDADEQALRALRMLPIDALALQHLVQADRDGRMLNATQLARALRLSTAGITKLIDRLARAGRVERRPNPKDRRGIIIIPAPTAERDLARAYGHIHAPLIAVIDELTDEEAATIDRFANRLSQALRTELDSAAPTPDS